MSSARSITAAVNPPRAVYLDYPLGHTAGKPLDEVNQMAVMQHTLRALADIKTPGTIVDLPYQWHEDDAWKERVMRPDQSSASTDKPAHEDDRVERHDTPQYQTAEDASAAQQPCPTCVFLEEDT